MARRSVPNLLALPRDVVLSAALAVAYWIAFVHALRGRWVLELIVLGPAVFAAFVVLAARWRTLMLALLLAALVLPPVVAVIAVTLTPRSPMDHPCNPGLAIAWLWGGSALLQAPWTCVLVALGLGLRRLTGRLRAARA